MNKKIDLSSIKGNESALVAVAMIFLAILMGVAIWLTVNDADSVQKSIDKNKETAEIKVMEIQKLEKIKADQPKFKKEVGRYDNVIAESGTYTQLDKQIELEDMLVKYHLTGTAIAGSLEPYAGVQMATSEVEVVGKEADVKGMCKEILNSKYIVRIDSFQIADNGDGTVTAAFTIVDFTK